MRQIVSAIALLGTLTLTACGGGSGPDDPKIPGSGNPGGTALTKPLFAPGDGILPIPNDLLFNGTTDLTLNIPVADPTDFSNPQVAISALDGWSAIAPFSYQFSGSIDGSTVIPGQTVRMFRVSALRDPDPNTGVVPPTGPVTGVEAELQAGVDFVASGTGTGVAIVPLKPWVPQASYMVVLTNGIIDANGVPVIADGQYAIAKTTEPLTGATAGLEPVRQLVNAMEAAAEGAGVTRADIVLSVQFTVQSIGDVIGAVKATGAAIPSSTSFSSLFTDTAPFTGLGAADLYKGSVSLPYYLEAPTAANPLSVLNNRWTAAAMIPIGPGGTLVPNPFGAGSNLTYSNPFPEITGFESAPLFVAMPKAALGCAKPAGGYPVSIFIHGITSNRTSMLGLADSYAAPPACTAVIAMDQPIHGIAADNPVHLGLQAASGGAIGLFEGYAPGGVRERTFGVDYIDNATSAPGPDGIADPSGAHTINLTNLLASRDNLRQAIVDILALERAIPSMDVDGDSTPDFDASRVAFTGHSLGGMVGSTFVAFSNDIKAAVLANPGGGIANLLVNSENFAPRINAGLAAAGIQPGTPDYLAFLFAAQTVIDAGDPVAHSFTAVAANVPTLLMQNVGDPTIPNSVATAPLSGTAGMFTTLDMTRFSASTTDGAGLRAFISFNTGGHASFLSPSEGLAVTVEMQTQAVNFIASQGTALVVTDDSVIEP